MKKAALLACWIVCIAHSWTLGQAPAASSPVGAPPTSGAVAPTAPATPAASASSPNQQWESQVVTGYRAQYTTRVETVQQEMIQPVVKYVLEKPFFGGTPRWVARTYYEQRTMTVAIPRTYQQMVPQTQVVRRPISSPNAPQFATAPTQTAARPASPTSTTTPPQSMFAGSPQPVQGTSLGPAYGHVPMTANQPQYFTPQAPSSAPLLWSAPAHQGSAPSQGTGAYYSAANLAPYGRADLTGYGSVSSLDGDPPRFGVQTPQYGSVVR